MSVLVSVLEGHSPKALTCGGIGLTLWQVTHKKVIYLCSWFIGITFSSFFTESR